MPSNVSEVLTLLRSFDISFTYFSPIPEEIAFSTLWCRNVNGKFEIFKVSFVSA